MMLTEFVRWLGDTRASKLIADTEWVIPAAQSVHILAIAGLITSMAMLDLRLIGVYGRGHSIQSLAARFIPWLWRSLIILLATGAIMIAGEPDRELVNWVFQLKMSMLAAVLGLTVLSIRVLKGFGGAWDRGAGPPLAARLVGSVSLLLWLAILVAGRWIAYT